MTRLPSRLKTQKADLETLRNRLRAVADVQFLENIRNVRLHRVLTDRELGGHLFASQTLR